MEKISGLQLTENLLTEEEESNLIHAIDNEEWCTKIKRRTQLYGQEKETSKPIPDWCTPVIDRLVEQDIVKTRPNQVSVNEFTPGQGISHHLDNVNSYEDGIVSVSLESDVMMEFIREKTKVEVTLPRRSAISMHGEARYEWRNGIASRKTDHGVKRGRHVSLTFRTTKEKPKKQEDNTPKVAQEVD